jgi:hypothetical protein
MSNENAILALKQAHQDFAELISSLPEEKFLSPMNGWSPRDVIAHLIGWNSLMIESSLSILAGEPPSYYDDARNDYSNINSGFITKHSSRSKQALLAELRSSMDNFEAFIHSLPAEELTADHGVFHYKGNPATVNKIINSLAGDYQHHTNEITQWLNK